MNIFIREYKTQDAENAAEIWNQVVRDGVAFPQEKELTTKEIYDLHEEKLKFYRKENVFRTVSYPIAVADFEIIRGDNMKQENGYRTGIFINGKEKIFAFVGF